MKQSSRKTNVRPESFHESWECLSCECDATWLSRSLVAQTETVQARLEFWQENLADCGRLRNNFVARSYSVTRCFMLDYGVFSLRIQLLLRNKNFAGVIESKLCTTPFKVETMDQVNNEWAPKLIYKFVDVLNKTKPYNLLLCKGNSLHITHQKLF